MDQIPGRTRRGRGTPFVTDPKCTSAANMVDLVTIHEVPIGRLVRCDYWLILLFHIYRIHLIKYACLNLCM